MHARILKILILVLVMCNLTGCLATGGTSFKTYRACAGRDYCPERDGPRQYVRAPDGWSGKYCSQNPMEC